MSVLYFGPVKSTLPFLEVDRLANVPSRRERSMCLPTVTILHLPTELLYKTFSLLHRKADFYNRNLQNVSLTCRRFRSLAQPLIFHTFVIDCDEDDENNVSSRHLARLDFYSSDAIAPFVREFQISINSFSGNPYTVQPEYLQVATKFFHALPRFTNIRVLSCLGIDFTEFALHQLSTLSSLAHLSVLECSAPPKADPLPMLRPRFFECVGEVDPDESDQLLVEGHHWLALLDTNQLQVLHVRLTHDLCSFFIADANPSFSPFPSLHSVDLDIDTEMLPMLPMVLSKTPAMRNLKLSPSYSNNPQPIPTALTTCPVPHLENYYGPHNFLPMILSQGMGSCLRRVFLESFPEADPLDCYMDSFHSCHPLQLRVLTHIHVSLFEWADLKCLAKLQDMFPVLQVFNLHSSEDCHPSVSVQNVNLTDLYTIPLPSTLVSLSIQWSSDGDTGVVPDLVAVKDNIVPRLPDLRRLWLCDLSQLALLWNRTALGTEESCTLHEAGSQDDVWIMDELVDPEHTFFGCRW